MLPLPPPTNLVTHHMTSLPSPWVHKTHGQLSATTTIATTIPIHHATFLVSAQPPEIPGAASAATTTVFTQNNTIHHLIHAHHTLVSIHTHCPCQSRPSKWSTTHRGLCPPNPLSAPLPPFATTCHMRAQDLPADVPQHLLRHGPSTPCSLSSAAVVPCYGFIRNEDPLHLVNNSHACLGDIFDGRCDWEDM